MAIVSDSTTGQGSREGPLLEARKLVTVLFCDLEGSTQLGELLDIEHLRALLLEYFEAMAAVVDEWGGSVEKYIGDAILAVFGVPTAHEDDAARALRAGLEMHDRLAEINPSLKDRYGVELSMSIRVNTGEVLSSADADSVVGGDVFNVAARLEGVAESGTVVLSERTHHAIEGSFEFAFLGEFALKGKSESERVWRVLGPHFGVERPFETELVGRVAELGMLDALLEQAIGGGSPRLVIIVGETGIGKSRLVREFVSNSSGQVTTLLGRCLPDRDNQDQLASIVATSRAKVRDASETDIEWNTLKVRIIAARSATHARNALSVTFGSFTLNTEEKSPLPSPTIASVIITAHRFPSS